MAGNRNHPSVRDFTKRLGGLAHFPQFQGGWGVLRNSAPKRMLRQFNHLQEFTEGSNLRAGSDRQLHYH